MTSRSTDTELDRFGADAADLAAKAAVQWGGPALVYGETGFGVATGCSFSRRGGDGATWESRWQGSRVEGIGHSDTRSVWTGDLGSSSVDAMIADGPGSRPSDPDKPFRSERTDDVGGDDRILVDRLVDAASGSGRFRLVEAEIRRLERHIVVCRSGSGSARRFESSVRWRLRLLAEGARDYEEWTGVGLPDYPERMAIEAAELALDRTGSRRPASGPVRVHLSPDAASVWLHEVLGHALEADYENRGGGFPLTGVGLRVWSVPLHAGSPDDEGNPERRVELSSGGNGRMLITDERHAGDSGLPRTGNGRRQDFRRPVRPRIGAIVAEPLDDSVVRLASDGDVRMADGIPLLRIASVLAGRVIPNRDAYVLDVGRAERFVGGQYDGPVGRFRLRGRVSDALAGVLAVGREWPGTRPDEWSRRLCVKDGQVVETANACPSVLLDGLVVDSD